jgi:hypothetical protein
MVVQPHRLIVIERPAVLIRVSLSAVWIEKGLPDLASISGHLITKLQGQN